MRGTPSQPVICSGCGRENACARDGRCHSCRIKSHPNPNQRFFWTSELDERLRRVYGRAATRAQLTGALNDFQRQSGFTRVVITARACELGLARHRRAWSQEELFLLREQAGSATKAAIARTLGRSYYSVKYQSSRLRLSTRITEGYSQEDLQTLLGVGRKSIQKWLRLRWLKLRQGRISESSVAQFLRAHPEEYQLNRVEEAWFKGLLFPSFNTVRDSRVRGQATSLTLNSETFSEQWAEP